jgi:hypothetical protein
METMDTLDRQIDTLLSAYHLKDILEASDMTEASALRFLVELDLVELPDCVPI